MNINFLSQFLKKYKLIFLYITILFGFFLISGEALFAAEEPVLSAEDSEKVVEILNLIITGAAALMGMVTSFITMFLYPGWTNGTLFGLQDYLKEIWILVSNVVYFIFAFILITIAFMNIIGKGDGNWELKQAMPKFVIGVLIVPFSWFFVQFLLSISAILTVGVLTLPYDSFSNHDLFVQALDNTELAGEEICKDVVISFNGDFEGKNVEQLSSEENDLDENVKCLQDGKVTIKELITGLDEDGNASADAAGLQNSIFGVISIYSYGILRIHDLDTITGSDLESVETIVDLVFKIVFDVLFVLVYLLLMIALLLALFVRGVRLWIYMMLSPVFGLFYFFNKGEVSNDGGAKFGIKEFIHLALIPVYVSAALAFGLVFILVAGEGIKEKNDGEDTLKAGGFSLTILGAHGSGESEKSVIGKLVVEIFGIAILWIAVMFALSRSETTGNIIKPIADFGNSVGKLASAAPTYAPIIPNPSGGGNLSVASLPTIGSTLEAAPRQEAQKRGGEFADGISGPPSSTQKISRELRNSTQTQKENGQALEAALLSMGEGLFKPGQERREQIDAINQTLGTEIDLKNLTNPQSIASEIERALRETDISYSTTFRGDKSISNFVRDLEDGRIGNLTQQESQIQEGNNTINLTNITTANALQRANAMPQGTTLSEQVLRASLEDEGIPESQHDGIVDAFREANRLGGTETDSDSNETA